MHTLAEHVATRQPDAAQHGRCAAQDRTQFPAQAPVHGVDQRPARRELRADAIRPVQHERAHLLIRGDRAQLCLADTVWVVQGSFPTPMGGGFAAFATEASARDVGARTKGRVGRLHEFIGRARS